MIRGAVRDDAARVEAIHWASRNAAYKHVAGWPPQRPDRAERVELWAKWLTDPAIISLVAELDGAAVGICTVRATTDEDLDAATVAELPTLYVHPDVWHRGLGRSLCTAGLRRAKERGFETLILWSIETNTRADAFYTRFGFARDAVTKVVDWPHDLLIARRYRITL